MLKKMSAIALSGALALAPVTMVASIAHAQSAAPEPPQGATPSDNPGGGSSASESSGSMSSGSMSSGSGKMSSKHHMKKHHMMKKHHHHGAM